MFEISDINSELIGNVISMRNTKYKFLMLHEYWDDQDDTDIGIKNNASPILFNIPSLRAKYMRRWLRFSKDLAQTERDVHIYRFGLYKSDIPTLITALKAASYNGNLPRVTIHTSHCDKPLSTRPLTDWKEEENAKSLDENLSSWGLDNVFQGEDGVKCIAHFAPWGIELLENLIKQ